MTAPIVQIDQLSLVFVGHTETVAALRGISLHVDAGEIVGLVGESGSGKSATAMSILRLLPFGKAKFPEGRITVLDRDVLDAPESLLQDMRGAEVAMIFQEPMTALNPVLRIGEQITDVILRHQSMSQTEATTLALNLLRDLQIADPERALAAYPHELSGGMRQRVMIAMAFSCHPKLIIADEPTTALDVTIQREVLDLINELVAEDGMGLLLISHDLGVMAETVQRMLVMYGGTVVESGPTDALFARGAHPYTRGLFAARPRLGWRAEASAAGRRGHRLLTIPGRVPELADLPSGCGFADRCPLAIADCRRSAPPAVELAPGHAARCIRLADADGSDGSV